MDLLQIVTRIPWCIDGDVTFIIPNLPARKSPEYLDAIRDGRYFELKKSRDRKGLPGSRETSMWHLSCNHAFEQPHLLSYKIG